MSEWTPEMAELARRLCAAATPGPWMAEFRPFSFASDSGKRCYGIAAQVEREEEGERWTERIDIVETDCGVYPPEVDDALFIAHARTLLPAALAEIERLLGQRP